MISLDFVGLCDIDGKDQHYLVSNFLEKMWGPHYGAPRANLHFPVLPASERFERELQPHPPAV
ncbi:MAG: uncharacterized protein KVP18_001607 [Porospora cf. gigantea A]|uniref:uncharacterized protein n=1 Tax=Porospora cf. gigantea A TaxID=2853593 RepID=UPI00355A0043|nr:MAG: hypothetical protein KVP18_001607 [Porospora cf. gigantea A]